MKSRFLPYATTPGRLTAQLVSDLLIAAWITGWVLVGLAVHHAIATIAGVGRQVRDGADGHLGQPQLRRRQRRPHPAGR